VTGIADRPFATATARLSLAGVRMDAVNGLGPKDLLRPLLASARCQHVITANVEYLRRAAGDERLREVLAGAALVVPDGMHVVWAAKIAGAEVSRRVTGHDLTQALAEMSASEGVSLFLLGAAPGVADRAAAALRDRYPGVRIAGTYSPPDCPYPFPEGEDRRIVEAVNASGARALLVALGCPKQDLWLAAHGNDLKASVAIGVGGVFDVLAGTRRRAPGWAQTAGLEWVYRMMQEPRRLLPRYVKDALFVSKLFVGAAASRFSGGGEAGRGGGPR
jgi:N-acetylglucosaminyldiphosphoundecaprenol N-acetyl-beta-D-mannosaminyltransferase